MLTADQASTQGVRAAWVGLAGMGATALLQLVIVAISGSVALLADTLHNLGHLATTIPLIIAFRLGRRRPTPTYPYGFRRAEDLVGLLIAVVIAVSAVLVVVESVDAFLDPRPVSNLGWVLAAGLVGAAGNEAVAVYRIRAGRRIGSMALVAEGQHARTDGLTSLAVVLGVIGVWAGFPQADALVGFAIAVVIIAVLVATVRVTVRRLMDGVEPDVLATIAAVAADVPGVVAVGRVRARWTGHRLEAEVDISVDGSSTVSHGHSVAEAVHHDILHRVPGAHHVAVHVNPEGDAHAHGLTQHHSST
jgi:cation diffusion facilitator family transporter